MSILPKGIGIALAQARERAGMPQAQLARRINVSRGLVGMIESGDRTATPEMVAAAAAATGDLRLIAEAMWSSPIGLFAGPVLDKADLHPVACTDKLREELQEADAALSRLKLVNRRIAADLDEFTRAALDRAGAEVFDLLTGITNWLTVMADFGLDVRRLRSAHLLKLRSRGYTSAVAR